MDLEFEELKREFLEEARTKVEEIAGLLDGDGFGTGESRDRGTYLAHQLKGAGGSYGYADISAESASLENDLEASPVEGGQIAARVDSLRRVIEERLKELST
ncbi:MAG: Hpt domain-containing protein [Thermoanaerobaculia bacterium]